MHSKVGCPVPAAPRRLHRLLRQMAGEHRSCCQLWLLLLLQQLLLLAPLALPLLLPRRPPAAEGRQRGEQQP
jgi:hypothetical protein